MKRGLWLMAVVALLCACGDPSGPAAMSMAPPSPVALYGSCDSSTTCMDGSCFVFESVGASVCSVECSTDGDCPAPPPGLDTGALCDSGHCRSFACYTTSLNSLGDDRICIHGRVMECAELTDRVCQCGCEDGTGCNLDSNVCMPLLALNEHCQKDYECATGYCGTKIDGYKSLCKKPPGASCDPQIQDPKLHECDALCTAPPGGAEGYCLQFRVHACGSNSCQTTCPDHFTTDAAAVCWSTCHVDGDCKDWEQCTFDKVTDVDGRCVPRP